MSRFQILLLLIISSTMSRAFGAYCDNDELVKYLQQSSTAALSPTITIQQADAIVKADAGTTKTKSDTTKKDVLECRDTNPGYKAFCERLTKEQRKAFAPHLKTSVNPIVLFKSDAFYKTLTIDQQREAIGLLQTFIIQCAPLSNGSDALIKAKGFYESLLAQFEKELENRKQREALAEPTFVMVRDGESDDESEDENSENLTLSELEILEKDDVVKDYDHACKINAALWKKLRELDVGYRYTSEHNTLLHEKCRKLEKKRQKAKNELKEAKAERDEAKLATEKACLEVQKLRTKVAELEKQCDRNRRLYNKYAEELTEARIGTGKS